MVALVPSRLYLITSKFNAADDTQWQLVVNPKQISSGRIHLVTFLVKGFEVDGSFFWETILMLTDKSYCIDTAVGHLCFFDASSGWLVTNWWLNPSPNLHRQKTDQQKLPRICLVSDTARLTSNHRSVTPQLRWAQLRGHYVWKDHSAWHRLIMTLSMTINKGKKGNEMYFPKVNQPVLKWQSMVSYIQFNSAWIKKTGLLMKSHQGAISVTTCGIWLWP